MCKCAKDTLACAHGHAMSLIQKSLNSLFFTNAMLYLQHGGSVVLVSRSNVFLPGNTLEKVGECEKRLGEAEREFLQTSAISFLTPLRNFLEGDWRTISVSLEHHVYSNAVWVIHPIYTIYHTLYHDKVILWYSVCCKTIMYNTSWYQYDWKRKISMNVSKNIMYAICVCICVLTLLFDLLALRCTLLIVCCVSYVHIWELLFICPLTE